MHLPSSNVLRNCDFTNPWAVIDRPSQCTFCCCEHAELSITQNSKRIGKVSESVTCYDPHYIIHDEKEEAKWKVWADGDQRAIGCCSCTPPGVGECTFGIYPPEVDKLDLSLTKGKIKKLYMGLGDLVGSTTVFEIDFPENATPIEKFFILANTIQLDCEYFDYGLSLRRNNLAVIKLLVFNNYYNYKIFYSALFVKN